MRCKPRAPKAENKREDQADRGIGSGGRLRDEVTPLEKEGSQFLLEGREGRKPRFSQDLEEIGV